MLKDRRLWFLATVLIGLVLLLAQPRGTAHVPPPQPPLAAVADSDHAAAGDAADDVPGPRHPEIGFRSRERLEEHFKKHGRDFHVKTADDYLRMAQLLRDQPRSSDVLEIVRNDAVTCKFDRETGAFVAYNSDGTLRTFFRPRDGEAYFERQKTRTGEAP